MERTTSVKLLLALVIIFLFPIGTFAKKEHSGKVKYVIDGDTIILENNERVRLIGVDAPETNHPEKPIQCFGQEATEFLKTRLEGKEVSLKYDRKRIDKYGRTLGYIYFDKVFINQELVQTGNAVAYTRYPCQIQKAIC